MSNKTSFDPKKHGIEKFGTITMTEDGNLHLMDFEMASFSNEKNQSTQIVVATILSDFFQAFAEHVKSQEEL